MRRRGAPQSLHGFAIEQCERANRTGRAAPMVPLSAPLHCPSAHPPSPSLPKNRATLVGPVPTPPNRIRAGNHVFSGRQRDSRAPRQRTPRAGTPLASGDRVAVVWRPRGGRLPLTSWSAVGSHGRHRRQAVCRRCTARGFPIYTRDTGHTVKREAHPPAPYCVDGGPGESPPQNRAGPSATSLVSSSAKAARAEFSLTRAAFSMRGKGE